MKCKNH